MSRLNVKLKMCKGCAEDGFITEIAQAPGVYYLRCRNADCPTTCWYACGLCKAAYMHYAAETDADRTKFAKHLRSKHKVTSDIGPSVQRTLNPVQQQKTRLTSDGETMDIERTKPGAGFSS